jgi:hypothetical protein
MSRQEEAKVSTKAVSKSSWQMSYILEMGIKG